MANLNTSISWTDATWSPLVGCSILSPGCKNCYAQTLAARLARMGVSQYDGLTHMVNSHAVWTGEVRLVDEALTKPLHWKKPRRIFVNSMSDLFHESVPDEWIDRVFAVMALCSQHIFQILTKRAERMYDYITALGTPAGYHRLEGWARAMGYTLFADPYRQAIPLVRWPLGKVHLGVSVEDQPRADARIQWLRQTPAAVRFISFEPLLGPVQNIDLTGIHWAIVGCESGPRRRTMSIEWARSIRDQCVDARGTFFMKQIVVNGKVSTYIEDFPADLQIQEFPGDVAR